MLLSELQPDQVALALWRLESNLVKEADEKRRAGVQTPWIPRLAYGLPDYYGYRTYQVRFP